ARHLERRQELHGADDTTEADPGGEPTAGERPRARRGALAGEQRDEQRAPGIPDEDRPLRASGEDAHPRRAAEERHCPSAAAARELKYRERAQGQPRDRFERVWPQQQARDRTAEREEYPGEHRRHRHETGPARKGGRRQRDENEVTEPRHRERNVRRQGEIKRVWGIEEAPLERPEPG